MSLAGRTGPPQIRIQAGSATAALRLALQVIVAQIIPTRDVEVRLLLSPAASARPRMSAEVSAGLTFWASTGPAVGNPSMSAAARLQLQPSAGGQSLAVEVGPVMAALVLQLQALGEANPADIILAGRLRRRRYGGGILQDTGPRAIDDRTGYGGNVSDSGRGGRVLPNKYGGQS